MKPESVQNVHIGVDVSKAKLDIYVPAAGEGTRPTTEEVGNDIEGFRKLRDLARKAQAVVCEEPTGGYELELIASLQRHGVPVAYADASRVRHFARAEGCLSKSDAIDAALISRFADKVGVRVLDGRDADVLELRRKVRFRQTLLDARKAMVSRLETETDAGMRKLLGRQARGLDRLIREAEESCLETVAGNEAMSSRLERFTAVGGVGDLTAVAILAGLPEIGTLTDAQLNRLVGIAPEERQSGTREWRRHIRGGRKDVRNALYMACVAAVIWNDVLGTYYRKKRAEGHPHKWAIVPTMRKLLSLLNRIARDPDFVPRPEPESTRRNAPVGRKKKTAK